MEELLYWEKTLAEFEALAPETDPVPATPGRCS